MTEYLDVPGGRISYDVAGSGPLVVMAPGMGDLRGSYRFLVPVLVEAGYRVATMDLRGHGESSTGWDRYTTAAVGEDYVALIRHLGGGPATVVGQSFTPDSAVRAAVELPEEVTGVVAIAPWAKAPKPNPVMAFVARRVLSSPLLFGLFYTSLYKGPKPADFAPYLKGLKARLREPGRTEALLAVGRPEAHDGARYRARVRQPALVVMGSADTDFPDPRAEAEEYAAGLGGPTEVVMVEGAGHYPHAQFPAETAAAVLAFLERTARG